MNRLTSSPYRMTYIQLRHRLLSDGFVLQHKSSTRTSRTQARSLSNKPTSSNATKRKRRPLDGITVVSLEQAIAAPYCTRQLADMGARVIKVERPGEGDFARAYDDRVKGQSSHFIWTNRSKESLALDLKTPQDSKVLQALLKRTDVFVQNLAPGAAARLGLSFEVLRREHPSLIVCDISGYGQDGPYRHKKAYDLLVQSEAGVLSVTGTPDRPAKAGIPVADIAAATFACSNILAALFQRERGGPDGDRRGCHIDVSMLESTVEWMGFPMYYSIDDQAGPVRSGASHPTVYPYGPFEVGSGADEASVMLGLQNEREWARFCAVVLRDPALAADDRFRTNSLRSENRRELKDIVCRVFAPLTVPQVLERLDEAGIANARVNDMRAVWGHPQLRARRRWVEIGTPEGNVPALLPPGVLAGDDDSVDSNDDGGGLLGVKMDDVPAVGQHNEQILAELGF